MADQKQDDESIAQKLRKRAGQLRWFAWATLALIFGILVAGAIVFFFAGQNVMHEGLVSSREVATRVKDAELSIKNFQTLIQPAIDATNKADEGKGRELQSTCQYLNNQLDQVKNHIQSIPPEIPLATAQATFAITSVILTRIGTALIVLFLVQILVSLYRYNTRLATFYESRADAIELIPSEKLPSLPELTALLDPSSLDFGRSPKMPIEQIVEIAKIVRKNGA